MAMGICLPAKLRRRLGGVLALCMVASQGRAGAASVSEGMAKNGVLMDAAKTVTATFDAVPVQVP